jgi:DNA-binding NarL/FixJ family response regulator
MTPDCPLTPRQIGIIANLADGQVRKQIATQLGVSESAVCIQIREAADRAKVSRKDAVLVATAIRKGWIV